MGPRNSWPVGLLTLMSAGLAACSSPLEVFQCRTTADCASADSTGMCESAGVCSFADPNCPGGRAYGEAAGHLSGSCLQADDAASSAGVDANAGANIDASSSCPNQDLGSAVGAAVATGTTQNAPDNFEICDGGRGDISYSWMAPATDSYTIDLCGSKGDPTLAVLNGLCMGPTLQCNDDSDSMACGDLNSRLTVTLSQGQRVTIIVDSLDEGTYILNITQL